MTDIEKADAFDLGGPTVPANSPDLALKGAGDTLKMINGVMMSVNPAQIGNEQVSVIRRSQLIETIGRIVADRLKTAGLTSEAAREAQEKLARIQREYEDRILRERLDAEKKLGAEIEKYESRIAELSGNMPELLAKIDQFEALKETHKALQASHNELGLRFEKSKKAVELVESLETQLDEMAVAKSAAEKKVADYDAVMKSDGREKIAVVMKKYEALADEVLELRVAVDAFASVPPIDLDAFRATVSAVRVKTASFADALNADGTPDTVFAAGQNLLRAFYELDARAEDAIAEYVRQSAVMESNEATIDALMQFLPVAREIELLAERVALIDVALDAARTGLSR
ncbi:MAG: hypothetical protein ABIH86_03900 [Planctomycetota bacterium]